MKRNVIDSMGRPQTVNFVSELGLYALVFSSKIEAARAFQRRVFEQVLPSIRKHGVFVDAKRHNLNAVEARNLARSLTKT